MIDLKLVLNTSNESDLWGAIHYTSKDPNESVAVEATLTIPEADHIKAMCYEAHGTTPAFEEIRVVIGKTEFLISGHVEKQDDGLEVLRVDSTCCRDYEGPLTCELYEGHISGIVFAGYPA